MKKKLLSALLCLVLALTLLPTAALAAPTRLKSVDLVIDLPKAGDPNEMETGNVKKCAVGKYPKSEKLGSAGQAACCACAHSRYLTGGSPSGLRV